MITATQPLLLPFIYDCLCSIQHCFCCTAAAHVSDAPRAGQGEAEDHAEAAGGRRGGRAQVLGRAAGPLARRVPERRPAREELPQGPLIIQSPIPSLSLSLMLISLQVLYELIEVREYEMSWKRAMKLLNSDTVLRLLSLSFPSPFPRRTVSISHREYMYRSSARELITGDR